jgi:hypothetical protein
MTFLTTGGNISFNARIINNTWESSGAALYLNTFLTNYTAHNQNLSGTICNISNTFAPPDTSEAMLYSILGGALGTVAGIGAFVGEALNEVGTVASGIAAFSAIFTDTDIGGASPSTIPERLGEILGRSLQTVFQSVNNTIDEIFNPTN